MYQELEELSGGSSDYFPVLLKNLLCRKVHSGSQWWLMKIIRGKDGEIIWSRQANKVFLSNGGYEIAFE